MKYLFYALATLLFQSGFYDLQFTDVNNSTVSLGSFQGKKVLLVNIATESSRVEQLHELQQLQDQHSDSLVVIAFPSNSFGNEPRTDAQIKSLCENTYNATFILASKGSVNGNDIQPIYNWLTDKIENGELDIPVGGDFQKYLINKEGKLVGVFAGSVNPLNYQVQNAIAAH